MFVLLSYTMSPGIPVPGGRLAISIQVDESLEKGNLGNTFYYTSWNHAGTHVDAPGHMLPGGQSIHDLDIHQLFFDHPLIVDVPKEDDQLIAPADLKPYEDAIAGSDLLLLRTGFSRFRATEPLRYQDRNPGLSVEVAQYLADPRFPSLCAVGIDAISMAAAARVKEGVEAHKILFKKTSRQPVLLIEDLDLSGDLAPLERVIVAPFFVEGLESSPCTVIAEIGGDSAKRS